MIGKLLSRFYQFAQSEYWRARCLKAEEQLALETCRNRHREDTITTMAISSLTGIVGFPPRGGPAQKQIPRAAQQPQRSLDPWDDLGAVELMEFETNWLPDAEAHNVPLAQAKSLFLTELANRKRFNDLPQT